MFGNRHEVHDRRHDQSVAMLFQPFLELRKAVGVRRRLARVITHVAMGNASTRLERLVGAFDLLGNSDRYCWIVVLCGQ